MNKLIREKCMEWFERIRGPRNKETLTIMEMDAFMAGAHWAAKWMINTAGYDTEHEVYVLSEDIAKEILED